MWQSKVPKGGSVGEHHNFVHRHLYTLTIDTQSTLAGLRFVKCINIALFETGKYSCVPLFVSQLDGLERDRERGGWKAR